MQVNVSRWLRPFAFMAAHLVLLGCGTRYPMGMNRTQWDALPPDKQAEYQAQQYAIDQRRQEQARAEQLDRQRAEKMSLEAEQQRLRDIYANARYGDIVRVVIEAGYLQIYDRRTPYHPVSIELARGETKLVTIVQVGSVSQSAGFPIRLSADGNTVYFDERSSDQAVLVNHDWERGQRYTSPDTRGRSGIRLVGATFFVKFKELPGAPQRVIIENR